MPTARRADGPFGHRRLLLVGAVGALLALAALATFFAWRQYDDGKHQALREVNARVVLASTVFDTYFAGELGVLQSIASSPSVMATDTKAMTAYFKRVQPPKGKEFTGGLGWIDLHGRVGATSSASNARPAVNVADRRYFTTVLRTQKPYISAGLVAKSGKRRILVMAVPTFDTSGRMNGVLAGALNLTPSKTSKRTIDLGFQGLEIIDRDGQEITAPGFPRPENTALLAHMRRTKAGLLADSDGLAGDSGHVVGYSTSALPDWITAIDRSSADVCAPARRSLELELASILGAFLVVLALLVWMYRRANRDAAAERRRLEVSSQLTRALADASAPGAVAGALAAALAATRHDVLAVVGLQTDEHPARLTLAGVHGLAMPTVDRAQASLLEPAETAYATGGSIRVTGQTDVADRFPELHRVAPQASAVFAAPIVAPSGRRLGAVALLFATSRRLAETDRAAIDGHVEQAVQALARTLRQEREHEVAVALQRSLLPEELPEAEALAFATRYHAGGVGVEVGGDWYDVVRRSDGILHVSVGDVAGRGIPAATLMAQLRNAFRAYALDHATPAEVTRRLARHVPEGGMVTTACLAIDPYTRRYEYALAGHPPILLLDRDTGVVTQLAEAGAPPLGFATPETIRQESGTLPDRAVLIAYTDGLVERRGASIDDGIGLVASVLAETAAGSVDEIADAVLRAATEAEGADDDAALIVVDVAETPAILDVEFDADPRLLAATRSRLTAWLELRGLDETTRIDTILAVHEACINAIEHGYKLSGGTIRVRLEHDGDLLRVHVEDRGEWRPPTPDPSRGRGILIMETAMHATRIDHGTNGTTVSLERRLTSSDKERGPLAGASLDRPPG